MAASPDHLPRPGSTAPGPDLRRCDADSLATAMRSNRDETLGALARLGRDAEAWALPYLRIINPPLWEIGHVGHFWERWCVRGGLSMPRSSSLLDCADAVFDSNLVPHPTRWHLRLPSPQQTAEYLEQVMQSSIARLEDPPMAAELGGDDPLHMHRLSLFHEMMHKEAFTYTWQTTARSSPVHCEGVPSGGAGAGRVLAAEPGQATIGCDPGDGFVFDNERWSLPVEIDSFSIDAEPLDCGRFRDFVASGAYLDERLWAPGYFAGLRQSGRVMPRYWRIRGEAEGRWLGSHDASALGRSVSSSGIEVRRFDTWHALEPARILVHVDAFEAEAYCRWANRRLPTEAQWQYAVERLPGFRWGDAVWEWTATRFHPLPGFAPDAYREYSAPWFETHRSVRGGSFATPRGMIHPRFRNFYLPDRGDIFIGFRTCGD
ncbi:MAG: SUMF1/EgtB/PvdO family nonheme iron enzyme [Burkholderiaceae bacterium]